MRVVMSVVSFAASCLISFLPAASASCHRRAIPPQTRFTGLVGLASSSWNATHLFRVPGLMTSSSSSSWPSCSSSWHQASAQEERLFALAGLVGSASSTLAVSVCRQLVSASLGPGLLLSGNSTFLTTRDAGLELAGRDFRPVRGCCCCCDCCSWGVTCWTSWATNWTVILRSSRRCRPSPVAGKFSSSTIAGGRMTPGQLRERGRTTSPKSSSASTRFRKEFPIGQKR
mmetsp:Transcript_101237/g.321506  ORF Transcript_101237/g.321506 Transcript_101237/m.321506 type:complete len:229 (+) Transcript_101237:237-923(+)